MDQSDELAAALSNRYEIRRELGRGGMAVVYLARDIKHGRDVAIKVIRPDLSYSLGAERFLREIGIAARLTHPNILSLHDSGEAAGLLYYVMPYVAGESLRRRLERERQLPVDEAIAIAKQIASALDYAHSQGVVHRDIKPENILMLGDQPMVADFGLARALFTSASAPLTESGLAVGTPAYMSPEQASADRAIDSRTDVYSLGCLVFEMIAGVPPFRGATAQALISHHVNSPPPSLHAERRSCPPSIDHAISRALAKLPADRFRSAGEFMRAIETSLRSPISTGVPDPRRRFRRRVVALLTAAAAALVAALVAVNVNQSRLAALDENRYAILPFTEASVSPESAVAGGAVAERMAKALGEWRGITIVDERRTREAIGASTNISTTRAIGIARKLGAARLVWGEVGGNDDSVTVRATLFDARRGDALRSRAFSYPVGASNGGPASDAYRILANFMVRERDELPWTKESNRRPASITAWRTYDDARRAIETWQLEAAEALLRSTIAVDPDHAQGQLWLAQILTWSPSSRTRDDRRLAARRALELSDRLNSRDSSIAAGLAALVDRKYPEACSAFGRVVAQWPRDFGGWYGMGDCQTRDRVVVADRRTPSGFAFRGSLHSGISAYTRAIDLLTSTPPDFPFLGLSNVLATQMSEYREGIMVVKDTMRFRGYPSLIGDTLAVVPYPEFRVVNAMPDIASRAQLRALERNRQLLRTLLSRWVRTAPDNPLAHEMLADMLETTGEIASEDSGQMSALREIRTSRSLSVTGPRRLRLARDEIRLLLKTENFATAAALADSVLDATSRPVSEEAAILAGLAALTGRRSRLAELLRLVSSSSYAATLPNGQPVPVPSELSVPLTAAAASAALGVCGDDVRTIRARVATSLESHYADSAERAAARDALLWRLMSQAVPCLGPGAVVGLNAADGVLQLQQAFATQGGRAVPAGFARLQVGRKGLRPGDVAIDYSFQEGWLLAASGDSARAIIHLDRSLGAMSTLSTMLIDHPAQAAGLVRAMTLRADLAAAKQDRETARRWALAVATLWSRGDSEVQPVVSRMRALAVAS